MQSFETVQFLAYVDRDLLERRATDLFDHMAAHDLDKALKLFAPQASVTLGQDLRAMPFYGRHQGLSAIRKVLRDVHIEYEVLRQDIQDVMLDGDRAVLRRLCRLRHRGTGKVCNITFCDWLRFEEGMIISLESVGDSMALAELVS
jgi:ketosteroid isomerase-like protein